MDRRRYAVHSSALPFLDTEKLFLDIASFVHQIRLLILQNSCLKAPILYWKIGKLIVVYEQQQAMKEEDHKELLSQLSEQLTKKFKNGVSLPILEECCQFYLLSSSFSKENEEDKNIVIPQFRGLLTWDHYRLLIYVNSPQARDFYEKEAFNSNWSAHLLEHFIKGRLFERLSTSHNKESVLRSAQESCRKLLLIDD